MGGLKCSAWAMSCFIQFKVEAAPLIYVIHVGMTQVKIKVTKVGKESVSLFNNLLDLLIHPLASSQDGI